jgi:flagellar hook-associated protein 1 FlgK
MANNMFYTGLSGLNVAQAALVTTGHNTANVYTAGYSRQTLQIASAGGTHVASVGFFGNGSKVTDVVRNYDQYLATQLSQATSLNQSLTTYYTQISQIDNLLADQKTGLATQMQSVFTAVQAVANTPADPAARQQLISASQALANKFRSMDEYLVSLNGSVNEQVVGSVEQINTYAEQIASLNKQVAMLSNATGTQAPNDLLDQRDHLVSELGKLVGVKLVVQDGGQYNVFIGNGQTLVLGDHATKLAAVQSASDPTRTTVATINAAGKPVELQESVLAGGSLGGLLQFRNETLTSTQNSLGRIAIAMADAFNTQQSLGMDLNGALGEDFFSQASPTLLTNARNKGDLALTPSFSDIGALTTSDYSLKVNSDLTYTVTRLSDNAVVVNAAAGFPVEFDGVSIAAGAGTAQAGDAFLIQPTRSGARDLTVQLTDPAKVAAASPIATGNTAGNQGSGAISAGSVDAAFTTPLAATLTLSFDSANQSLSGFPATSPVSVTLADGTVTTYNPDGAGNYDTTPPTGPFVGVPYTAGASVSFDGITVRVSGTPANGDTFTIASNVGGVSDGSNALLMGSLQNQKTMGNGSATFNGAYGQLVGTVGNKARQIEISNTAQTSLTTQITAFQQSVSGVNQDEETANLLMFQQMYQANAKVIQTASTMFDAVLGIAN